MSKDRERPTSTNHFLPFLVAKCRNLVLFALGWGLLLGSAARGADEAAPDLKYAWKMGEKYIYSIRIEMKEAGVRAVMQGYSYYTVQAADPERFTLRHDGRLHSVVTGTGPRLSPTRPRRPIRPTHPTHGTLPRMSRLTPYSAVETVTWRASEIKVDVRGRFQSTKGTSQMPFLMGNMSQLVIVPLPADGKTTWGEKIKCVIKETSGKGSGNTEVTNYPADEESTYTLGPVKDGLVPITKQYTLRTEGKIQGKPRMEMTGEGKIMFDTKLGLARSMEFQASIQDNSSPTGLKIPITVTFKLVEGKERDNILHPNLPAAVDNTKPLAAKDRDLALASLKSSDKASRIAAAQLLGRSRPDGHRSEVAKELLALMKEKDVFVRRAAAQALGVWATREEVPALLKLVGDRDIFTRRDAMEVLSQIKDEKGAEAIARRLAESFDRGHAALLLKRMGPVAEKAVLGQLEQGDVQVRTEACKILQVIGTQKSQAALKEAAKDTDSQLAKAAQEALEAVKGR